MRLSLSYFACEPRFVVQKLFTKEDPLYLHKVFGLIALCSFLYRYFVVYPRQGNLGFDGSLFDWLTILAHLALSSSSLIFRVLRRRILSRPMIIWEEYRLHAIVFTMRCVSVYAYGVLRPFKDPNMERLMLVPLVLIHHVLADEITRRFGPEDKSQTTVRVNNTSSRWTQYVLRFYSFYQFAALASHLVPSARMGDLGFNTLIAIQSSAFLMTLFRKGLIRYYSHGLWYTACLLVSLYHMAIVHPSPLHWALVMGAFALRVRFRMNKYAIWILFGLMSTPAVTSFLWTKVASAAPVFEVPSLQDLYGMVEL
ncbi:unnamed protein product [Symbiodinium sp. KB8]|nr:unnamed protein product [Symbiodinium sp. KB8]